MATDSQQGLLKVVGPSGSCSTHSIEDGETVIVGSSGNCGIKLPDPSIASMQCVLRLTDGNLHVQTWGGAEGTHVNGVEVVDETIVRVKDELRIGNCRIELVDSHRLPVDGADAEASSATESIGAQPSQPTLDQDPTSAVDASSDEAAVTECTEDVVPAQEVESSVSRCGSANCATKSAKPTTSAVVSVTLPPPELDPEIVSLLREEIDLLEAELAERDRQLNELKDLANDSGLPQEVVASGETERLVARLEDLLDELQRSDERVRVAEELLLAEQEVTRSQNEEQAEIQVWIGEIEGRIEAREQEWKAEREALNQRVEQAKVDRDEIDRRLAEQAGSNGQEEVILELRSELDKVREALDESRRRENVATEKLQEALNRDVADPGIENASREERLQLAEERAALSRERAELAKFKAQMDGEVTTSPANKERADADVRFSEFRKTLRELHEEERREAAGQPQKSLGRRIADLWARLDGKTDTD